MSEETKTEVYEIPSENFEALCAKIEKLNRRAKRLQVSPLHILELESIEEERTREGIPYTATIKRVQIVGESPVLPGWELIARLTPAEKSGYNYTRCVPGRECPAEFKTVDMLRCDHCHTRRHRKDTFVVRNTDSDKYLVVGRNCIADFLGNVSPESLLGRAELLFSAEDLCSQASEFDGFGFGGAALSIPLSLFVATTAIFCRRFGWVSRSAARDNFDSSATADEVWNFLCPTMTADAKRSKDQFREQHSIYVSEADIDLAQKALQWARGLNLDQVDGYLYNLSLSCQEELVKWKTAGLIASVLVAYNRHVEKLVELENKRKVDAHCVHVGEIKQRYSFRDCKVLSLHWFESNWGCTTLIVFRTREGNILKWWASGDREADFPVGDCVDLVGTVKSHDEYKGRKETVLTRCSLGFNPKYPEASCKTPQVSTL